MNTRTLWGSVGTAVAVLALLAVAACGVTSVTTGPGASGEPTDTPTATAVPPTATLTPPSCASGFSSGYYSQLPDPHYTTTQVYADIPLPPLSRIVPNDAAGGVRGYDICSAGTVASITDFMNTHLASQGWTNSGSGTWTKSGFNLNVVISSATGWNINWRDPDIHF
jgi:hypothetical protein